MVTVTALPTNRTAGIPGHVGDTNAAHAAVNELTLWAQFIDQQVKNVTDIRWAGGAKGTGADADKAQNDAAFAACLAGGGIVFVPPGDYRVSVEPAVTGNTDFYGIKGKSKIKAAAGANKRMNMLTNIGNTRTSHTTTDKNIWIRNLWFDGNRANRDASGDDITTQSTSGCGIGFACVENVRVTNCLIEENWLHNVDVAASVYGPNSVGNNLVQPAGPSVDVLFEDCAGGNVEVDDCFTTHNSKRVRFVRCTASTTVGPNNVKATQNGFELDEGSIDCSTEDCYAYGWIKGFQTKGHPNTPAADNSIFTRATAEACNCSFSFEYTTQSTISPAPGKWIAQNVTARDLKSIAPVSMANGSTTEFKGMNLTGYSNIRIDGFIGEGGAHNHITISNEAKHVKLRNIKANGCFTAQPAGMTQRAYITAAMSVESLVVDGFIAETAIAGAAVNYYNQAGSVTLRDIKSKKIASAEAHWVVRVPDWHTANISLSGIVDVDGSYENEARVDTQYDGTTWFYSRPGRPYHGGPKYIGEAEYGQISLTAGTVDTGSGVTNGSLFSSGTIFYRIDGYDVTMWGQFTRNATVASPTTFTAWTMPTGAGAPANTPGYDLPLGLFASSTAFRGWMSKGGYTVRGVWAPSTTYYLPPTRYLAAL